MEQRTKEWLQIRRGRFTSSDIVKLIGTGKTPCKFGNELTDWPDTAQAYIVKKASQFFSTQDQEIDSREMKWGRDHEPEARAYYEAVFECEVEEVGFVLWPGNNHAGCSPDGLITKDSRGLEIKCPFLTEKHMEGLILKTNADLKAYNAQYYWQVMSSLLFTCFERWDFVSYHPYYFPKYRISCIEILPDKQDFEILAERIHAAVNVMDKIIQSIEK